MQPFGLGWDVSVPFVHRRSSKRLPTYDDQLDVFAMAGSEDLVRLEGSAGSVSAEEDGRTYQITRFRPRVDNAHSRMEMWVEQISGESHWRMWSAANMISIFGQSPGARVSNPDDPAQVFAWHLERQFDAFGNLITFEHAREDHAGVDLNDVSEAHRAGVEPASLYLKRVRYANRTPFDGLVPSPDDFCFTLLFDYGEHDTAVPEDTPSMAWPARPDPYSRYDAGFERRIYRRCQRVLMMHRFLELGIQPEPVRALEIAYAEAENGLSLISAVRSVGFQRNVDGSLASEGTPWLNFDYQGLNLQTEANFITTGTGSGIKGSLAPDGRQWQDLMSEGLPGLVRETGAALHFRRNLGQGRLDEERALSLQTNLRGLGGAQTIETIAGTKSVVHREQGIAAFAGLNGGGIPSLIRSFGLVPTVGTRGPQLRSVDLDGDGLADLLQTDGDYLYWYPSRGAHGHARPRRLCFPVKNARASSFLFGDKLGRIFLADMSGDGLTDVVRVENGRVVYWPNLGHGLFGTMVQMRDAPQFDRPDQFDPARIRLGDVDGSGLADLVYLGRSGLDLWLNSSGNAWCVRQALDSPFRVAENHASVELVDVTGSGTAALVWTSSSGAATDMRYAELTSGKKPYLLSRVENGMGAETLFSYTPSTDFFLADEAEGRPWLTHLPFPVQCLAKTEQIDHVSGLHLTSVYTYHHGAYDPVDREFRGFARVDQTDTEVLAETGETEAPGRPYIQPPVLKRTWFHTGVTSETGDLAEALAAEFYAHPALPDISIAIEMPDNLGTRDWREAHRAMRGSMLRQEIFALDDTPLMANPFTITAAQYRLELRQAAQGPADEVSEGWAVFQRLDAGSINLTLDRRPEDPRIDQSLVLGWNEFGQPLRSATIAFARSVVPGDLPEEVAAAQSRTAILLTEHSMTRSRMSDDDTTPAVLWETTHGRNLPRPVEEVVEEVAGLLPGVPAAAADVEAGIGTAKNLDYSEGPGPGVSRRVLSRRRTIYLADDLITPLPLGEDRPLGLMHSSEQLAFTPETLASLFLGRVDESLLDQAGYVRSIDAAGVREAGYWAPSGTNIFDTDAARRFYLPSGTRDPFGVETRIELDDNLLLPVRAVDAARMETVALNDYRVLAPRAVRDHNLNWTAAAFNALGQVTAVARMGKVTSTDAPTGYEPCEGDTLDNPSEVYKYEMHRWAEEARPVKASTTIHTAYHHRTPDSQSRETLASHAYADGAGNVIMTKVQAAPGPAQEIASDGTLVTVDTAEEAQPRLRWVGNGRTVYNNKGQPLRTFEPYFSTSPEFEDDPRLVEQGTSTFNFYDAAGRGIGAFGADGTWVKSVQTPWRSEEWDTADTCLISDPESDAEVGGHFSGLPPELVHPLWFAARSDGALGADAKSAALASAEHAATPATSHTDSQGRAIRRETMPDPHTVLSVQSELDVEGNLLSVTDARGNTVMRYAYGMMPGGEDGKAPLYQDSMDAGERWHLPDVLGRIFVTWDGRGHVMRAEFDDAGRPIGQWLTLEDGTERRVSAMVYGTDPERNTAGRTVEHWDQSGVARTEAFDFDGNILATERQFAEPRGTADPIDWGDDPASAVGVLTGEVFTSQAAYDALGRVTEGVAPHSSSMVPSVTYPTYDAGGALEQVHVSAPGMGETLMVERLTYDAKGQRQSIRYGNGVETVYVYEPETDRLSRLTTTRDNDGAVLQDLAFTYDAVGNITAQRDHAHQTVFFNNQVVEAHGTYRYDALYRLTEATGREHIDQADVPDWQSGWAGRAHPEDGARMRNYSQRFTYDPAGNLTQTRHVAGTGRWTRTCSYDAGSNRLAWTELGSEPRETFAHNPHGSITAMAHLAAMEWNFAEQLVRVDKGSEGHTEYTYDSAGQRVRKRRVFQDGRVTERLYFSGFEIYREIQGGAVTQERETLHVANDAARIALVETETMEDGVRLAAPAPLARYQLGNQLGSAVLELDETSALISYEEYHPYGTTAFHAVTGAREVPDKRYRYTGKERDEETGFTYHGARYYAPWLARWTAADPIGIEDGLNLYAYVSGGPLRAVDPAGTSGVQVSAREAVQIAKLRREQIVAARAGALAEQKVAAELAKKLAPGRTAKLSGDALIRHARLSQPTIQRVIQMLSSRAAVGTAATASKGARTGAGVWALPFIDFKDGANLVREKSLDERRITYFEDQMVELDFSEVYQSQQSAKEPAFDYGGENLHERGVLQHALFEKLPQEAGIYILEDVLNGIAYVGSSGDVALNRFLSDTHHVAPEILYDSGGIRITVLVPNSNVREDSLFIRMLEQFQLEETSDRNPNMLNARNEVNFDDYRIYQDDLDEFFSAEIMDFVSEIHSVDILVY